MIKNFNEFVLNENGQMRHRVFCDLDGVLVDFDRGFMELESNTENLTPKEYEKAHGKGSIWKAIDVLGEDFWINLQWTKDGRELWDYLKRYDPIILSSPSQHPGCISGKTKWVNSNLGIDQEAIRDPQDFTKDTRFILANHKHDYVDPSKKLLGLEPVLIDDFIKKLEKWSAAGGIGILHNDATDTIRVLEDLFSE
jgi:FMN phosphatase YigB (HAD superfamily)